MSKYKAVIDRVGARAYGDTLEETTREALKRLREMCDIALESGFKPPWVVITEIEEVS